MVGARNEVVAATGHTLVPGYVEPRAHPWDLVMPAALLRHVLPPGTAPPGS
jgi:adenine deaminase